jgi:subtilisin-like proprotein convertase family protein
MRKLITVLLATLVLAMAGCDGGGQAAGEPKPETNGKDQKADQWNYANNPQRFGVAFEYAYDALKVHTQGRAAQIPWPSDYWAYTADSTNVRFHGDSILSPVEKYDLAFNGWTPDPALKPVSLYSACQEGVIKLSDEQKKYYDNLGPAAKWQHENKGHGRAMNGQDDDADGKTDECEGGEYDGIEGWWGLCHAWTPAAVLEPEPLHQVTLNGVTFSVSDIKALLITQYDKSSAVMLGGRCNEKEVQRDEQGRMIKDECRDTNAGAFFVTITNMLGASSRAFAEDRTAGYQVWNQPVLGYRILEQQDLTEDEAVQKLGKPAGTKYGATFNSPDAVRWAYVKLDTDYISESDKSEDEPLTPKIEDYTHTDHYELVVEIDQGGKVVGGEWLAYSQQTHPDFLWLPLEGRGGNPHMSLAKVRELLALSRKTDTPTPPVDATLREFKDQAAVPVPDNDPNGIARTLVVEEELTIGSLQVRVDLEHTYIGDLVVGLKHGDREVVLHDKAGGSEDNLQKDFPVAEFAGQDARGEWTLTVRDTGAQDVGTLKGWSLLVGSGAAVTPATTRAYPSTQAAMAIPDGQEEGLASAIEVADEGVVRGLKVTLDLTHPYVGDLVVALVHGTQSVTLHAREGGSADDLKKSYAVEAFNGAALKGTWTLSVKDVVQVDQGTLNSWSLEVSL